MDSKSALSTACTIKIGNFEGPFDLLFHLIEKNKVNIYDIPISEITDQYMDYLFDMQKLDLDIASEFFLMASGLLHIKSKMLLPSRKEEDTEDEELDPREELREKLIEYKKYKGFSLHLQDVEKKWSQIYYKAPESYVVEVTNDNLTVSTETLVGTYIELLKRNQNKINKRVNEMGQIIQREKVSIKSKMKQLQRILASRGKFIFSEIFFPGRKSLTEIVTAFIALLVLVKTGKATIEQKKQFSDIFVKDNKSSRWM